MRNPEQDKERIKRQTIKDDLMPLKEKLTDKP
jgi:hypothetical protein